MKSQAELALEALYHSLDYIVGQAKFGLETTDSYKKIDKAKKKIRQFIYSSDKRCENAERMAEELAYALSIARRDLSNWIPEEARESAVKCADKYLAKYREGK